MHRLASPLLLATLTGSKGNMMPQVWSRVDARTRGRIFYARYDPKDLDRDEGCRQMIVRALFWAAGREVESRKKQEGPGGTMP